MLLQCGETTKIAGTTKHAKILCLPNSYFSWSPGRSRGRGQRAGLFLSSCPHCGVYDGGKSLYPLFPAGRGNGYQQQDIIRNLCVQIITLDKYKVLCFSFTFFN